MKKIVFDSYALIAFFRKEPVYEVVRDLLVKIANNESEAFMCSVNVGEIYYMLVRKANIKIAEAALASLKQFPIHFIDPDFKLCMEAAALKAKYSFSYADAFAAALTINKKATLITGDKEFGVLTGETNFKVKYL
ncbi:MAG: type II toxin-antitoxin system VapC family toxin [Ginsengibacter sp.]